jgi:translation elongation factor P/translation initiation factor 5A
MKIEAKELKKGDKIIVGGEELLVESVEISEIGKQGTQKCRIEAVKKNGEKVVLVRPADYPIEKA